ncbi:hypothetical protein GCM10009760_51010 [Kitasatospora kazusensis]|uniref:Uncharacterized protein n=1 Tax=Kitasatospora kazusensis TaxID=407974 RepID=A0ABN3A3X8_9ACTN
MTESSGRRRSVRPAGCRVNPASPASPWDPPARAWPGRTPSRRGVRAPADVADPTGTGATGTSAAHRLGLIVRRPDRLAPVERNAQDAEWDRTAAFRTDTLTTCAPHGGAV